MLFGHASASVAQTLETLAARPDPVETPIGTEANTPIPEMPETAPRRRLPSSISFKVATWNLAALRPGKNQSAQQEFEKPRKVWRHTFGAERTTAPWRDFAKSGLAADLVALQGVKSIRTVSRLFNARRYHIITSRQLLARSTVNSSGLAALRADAPATTALAFRRRRGVRISGFRHFLPRTIRRGAEPPAITAFRLRIYRRMLWVASADVPGICAKAPKRAICQHQATILYNFNKWIRERLSKRKVPLLLLGQWPESIAEKLKEVGYEAQTSLRTNPACSPQPSPMRLYGPAPNTSEVSRLANPDVPTSTPCAAIADLTFALR